MRPFVSALLGALVLIEGVVGSSPVALAASQPFELRHGTLGSEGWQYWDLVPDLAKVQFQAVVFEKGGLLESRLPPRTVAAINGGYWDHHYRPTTWVLDRQGEHGRQNLRSKGGVWAVRGGKPYIGSLAKLPFKPDFAVQNSPMLLTTGGVVAIKKDDGRRASRTVVCLEKRPPPQPAALHLIVIRAPLAQGPTLRETAEWLGRPRAEGGFACTVALNLDGGASTGIWLPAGGEAPAAPPLVPIGYGIALLPRD